MRRVSLGLLGRIFLVLLAVGLLPWALASFRLLRVNRDAMTEQVLRTHAVAAQTTAARVEAHLDARRAVAAGLAASELLQVDARSPAATGLLAELLRSPLEVAAVSVVAAGGEEVVRIQRRDRAEAVAAALDLPSEGELAVVRVGEGSWLRLEAPLAFGAGRLVLVSDLAGLAADLRPRELGALTDLVLVAADGSLVLGEAAALEQFPRPMLDAATSGKVSGSGRYPDAAGGAVLGAFAPVVGTPWVVLSRQPAQVAEATALELRRRSWWALGLALGLTMLGAVVAQRSLLRPLRELIAAQRELAGERPGAAPPAGGEIAQLKASFELLARRLREKEEIGKVFLGRYQVLEVVGEGAMGTVFRAWDPALERQVALKTVRFDGANPLARAEHGARLVQEAVAVARFNHPNIVGIYDVEETPEVAFLAMEMVDGESLERYLGRRGRLGPDEVVEVGLGMARGLVMAHGRGTLHRDVKPANVLLGRGGEVKIADFGISQKMAPLAPDQEACFGTPGFIPPETLQGRGHGPAGDFFAFGVTLYRLLTGQLPFHGATLQEVVEDTLRCRPEPPSRLGAELPAELESLVLELLARDPALRPQGAEVLARLGLLAARLPRGWKPDLAPAEGQRDGAMTRAMTAPAAGGGGGPGP